MNLKRFEMLFDPDPCPEDVAKAVEWPGRVVVDAYEKQYSRVQLNPSMDIRSAEMYCGNLDPPVVGRTALMGLIARVSEEGYVRGHVETPFTLGLRITDCTDGTVLYYDEREFASGYVKMDFDIPVIVEGAFSVQADYRRAVKRDDTNDQYYSMLNFEWRLRRVTVLPRSEGHVVGHAAA